MWTYICGGLLVFSFVTFVISLLMPSILSSWITERLHEREGDDDWWPV